MSFVVYNFITCSHIFFRYFTKKIFRRNIFNNRLSFLTLSVAFVWRVITHHISVEAMISCISKNRLISWIILFFSCWYRVTDDVYNFIRDINVITWSRSFNLVERIPRSVLGLHSYFFNNFMVYALHSFGVWVLRKFCVEIIKPNNHYGYVVASSSDCTGLKKCINC